MEPNIIADHDPDRIVVWNTSEEVASIRTLSIVNPDAFRNYARIVLTGSRRFDPEVDVPFIRSFIRKLLALKFPVTGPSPRPS